MAPRSIASTWTFGMLEKNSTFVITKRNVFFYGAVYPEAVHQVRA